MTNKEREIETLLAATVKALGCDIWGIEYRPRGRGRSTLKLYIDSAAGVTIDDCERVSQQVSALLDVEDPIAERYHLEVSSPGLDRVLFRREQYLANVGQQVDVRLSFPFEGRRRFEGQLAGLEGQDVILRQPAGEGLQADQVRADQKQADQKQTEKKANEMSDEGEEIVEYILPLQQIQRTRIVPNFGSAHAGGAGMAPRRRAAGA